MESAGVQIVTGMDRVLREISCLGIGYPLGTGHHPVSPELSHLLRDDILHDKPCVRSTVR